MNRLPTLAPRHWAVLYLLVAAIGVVVLLIAMPRDGAPEAPSACRQQTEAPARGLTCLEGAKPSILTAELAGSLTNWACQVQRGKPQPALDEPRARCAELRVEDLREQIAGFDNGLFIPLYSVLSLLVLGWLSSVVKAARGAEGAEAANAAGAATTANAAKAPKGPDGPHGVNGAPGAGLVHALMLAVALATVLLVALDRVENRRALVVIDRVEAFGVAAVLGRAPALDEPAFVRAAYKARRASLLKWAASGAWAAVLAAAFVFCLRETADRLAARPRWLRWPRVARLVAALPPLTLSAAALLFAAGSAAGLTGGAIALPAALLGAGMLAALGGMVAAALVVALAR